MGLELTALAGYNPMAAVSLWRKMDAQSESQPPEFLSTHPSNENRIEDLQVEAKNMKSFIRKTKLINSGPLFNYIYCKIRFFNK